MALLARSALALSETLAAVRDAGGEGATFTADVTDERGVAAAHQEIESSLGPAIDDDLDALTQRAQEVERDNLHALKVQRLADSRAGTPGW